MFRSKKPKPSLKVLWHGSNIKQQHHLNPSALITSKNSNLLDKGQFGQIYKGQYLRRNVAIKTINLKHKDEVHLMKVLYNKNARQKKHVWW